MYVRNRPLPWQLCGMSPARPRRRARRLKVRVACPGSQAVAAAVGEHGRLDVVVNIAGLGVFKPVHMHSEAEWDSVMFALCGGAIPITHIVLQGYATANDARHGCNEGGATPLIALR